METALENSEQKFKRERRYIVIKISDLVDATGLPMQPSIEAYMRMTDDIRKSAGKPPLECVVVESDWPEYEHVWAMIEARCTENKKTPAALIESLTNQLDEMRKMVVMEFSHDEIPVFEQGFNPHEMLEVVTADRCNSLLQMYINAVNAHNSYSLSASGYIEQLEAERDELLSALKGSNEIVTFIANHGGPDDEDAENCAELMRTNLRLIHKQAAAPMEVTPWVRVNEQVLDSTLLISDHHFNGPITINRISAWSDSECQAVQDYCLAIHISASDNDDYPVPEKPAVLDQEFSDEKS